MGAHLPVYDMCTPGASILGPWTSSACIQGQHRIRHYAASLASLRLQLLALAGLIKANQPGVC
jgi:hypothetical protein